MSEEGLSVQLDPEAARARKRSVVIAGHATSISLEDAFWRQVSALAEQRGFSINALVAEIDAARSTVPNPPSLSGALRVWVLSQVSET